MTDVITTRREGSILEVTLDRPKANAIDLKTSRLMGETFKAFRDDPELRVAIVKTAGDKFFCAGWDLRPPPGATRSMATMASAALPACRSCATSTSRSSPASTAWLWGAASSSRCPAISSMPPTTPASRCRKSAPARWRMRRRSSCPSASRYHIAMDLLFTGRWMDVAEAHRWGLVNEVLPKEKLEGRVWEIARLLASGPPLVFAAIKETAREAEGSKFQGHHEPRHAAPVAHGRRTLWFGRQHGGVQGLRTKKRDPVWKGK